MARVFLSYAREDASNAKLLAEALSNAGHEVWWDRHIQGGSRFAAEIDRALSEAEAVVVLWSKTSRQSAWVQDEAAEGRDTGRLVPVTLDSAKQPLGFRQYQAIDLSGWRGGSEEIEQLLSAIAALESDGSATPGHASEPAASRSHSRKYSVCVLPFVNMSGDAEQEYFSDGISEDIITDLSKVSALSVVARNTAFTFKGQSVRVPEVATELGVTHVLEGSVRKAGSRVRITAQLIDGAAGDHLWADRYDRDLTDIFDIQDEISKAIVAALKVKLLPQERQAIENRGTNNVEAYDLYLMARQYWISGNDGDPRRNDIILRLCRSAIEADPEYARAWALMALTQAWMRFRDKDVPESGVEAAERALKLDPMLPEPHCVKAGHFASEGRFEEANEEIATALGLDPQSWEANKEAGTINFRQGRLTEALEYFQKAARLMETDGRSTGMIVTLASKLGDVDAARRGAEMTLERAERALKDDSSNASALSWGANALAYLGRVDQAREWMRRATIVDPDNLIMRYNLACAAAAHLNDSNTAVDLIEPFLARATSYQIRHIEQDPDLDNIRGDPTFETMLANAKERTA